MYTFREMPNLPSVEEQEIEERHNTGEVCLVGPPGTEPRTPPQPQSDDKSKESLVYRRNSANIVLGPLVAAHQRDQIQTKDFPRSDCIVFLENPPLGQTTVPYTRAQERAYYTQNSYPTNYRDELSEDETDSDEEEDDTYSPGEDTKEVDFSPASLPEDPKPSVNKLSDSTTREPQTSQVERQPNSLHHTADESFHEQETNAALELSIPSSPPLHTQHNIGSTPPHIPSHVASTPPHSLASTPSHNVASTPPHIQSDVSSTPPHTQHNGSPVLSHCSTIEDQQVSITGDHLPGHSHTYKGTMVQDSVVTVPSNLDSNDSSEESYVRQLQPYYAEVSSKTDDDSDETPPLVSSPLASSNSSRASGLFTVLSELQTSLSKNISKPCTLTISTLDNALFAHSDSKKQGLVVSVPVPNRTPVVCVEKLSLREIKRLTESKRETPAEPLSLQNTAVSV